ANDLADATRRRISTEPVGDGDRRTRSSWVSTMIVFYSVHLSRRAGTGGGHALSTAGYRHDWLPSLLESRPRISVRVTMGGISGLPSRISSPSRCRKSSSG